MESVSSAFLLVFVASAVTLAVNRALELMAPRNVASPATITEDQTPETLTGVVSVINDDEVRSTEQAINTPKKSIKQRRKPIERVHPVSVPDEIAAVDMVPEEFNLAEFSGRESA